MNGGNKDSPLSNRAINALHRYSKLKIIRWMISIVFLASILTTATAALDVLPTGYAPDKTFKFFLLISTAIATVACFFVCHSQYSC